jgi:hypothetical protein
MKRKSYRFSMYQVSAQSWVILDQLTLAQAELLVSRYDSLADFQSVGYQELFAH